MSKINRLTVVEVQTALTKVEADLKMEPRATKAAVIRSLNRQNLCAVSSTDAANTFKNKVMSLKLSIPPKFAEVFSLKPTQVGEKVQEKAKAPATETQTGTRRDSTAVVPAITTHLNLKGVSVLLISTGNATAVFPSGRRVSIGDFDESAFRSNSNLIEFNI